MATDELTETQALDLIRDPGNSERLYGTTGDGQGGDPALKAQIERAFAKANPERAQQIRESVGSLSPEDLARPQMSERQAELERQFANPPAGRPEEFGEVTAAEIEADQRLRQEHGGDLQQFIQDGGRGLGKLFDTRGEIVAFIQKSGILNDGDALYHAQKLLARLGRSR